jgi:hypothetical protein
MQKLDAHYYDGNLYKEDPTNILRNSIALSKYILENHKRDIVLKFVNELININSPYKNSQSLSNITTVVNSYQHPTNFDQTNNIHADDLLYILAIEWAHIPDKLDLANELYIQFSDMSTGMCSQGRVSRLGNIANVFIEWYA